jgi:hypothetical protein
MQRLRFAKELLVGTLAKLKLWLRLRMKTAKKLESLICLLLSLKLVSQNVGSTLI